MRCRMRWTMIAGLVVWGARSIYAAPSVERTRQEMERLVRAHLGDVAVADCATKARFDPEPMLRVRFEKLRDGFVFQSEQLGGDYEVSNCLDDEMAQWLSKEPDWAE